MEAMVVKIANQALRRRGAAAQDAHVARGFPVRASFLQFRQNAQPYRGDGAGHGYTFALISSRC